MNVFFKNGRRYVIEEVKPPIVLRSLAEEFIAQSAHNLLWDKNQKEYNELSPQVRKMRKEGTYEGSNVRLAWLALHERVKAQQEALIIEEIGKYRKENAEAFASGNAAPKLLELIEELRQECRGAIDEAQQAAEEAQSAADEARAAADEAMDAVAD